MKAAQIVEFRGSSGVEVREIDAPTPAENQVLIEVQAAGVSFPEVLHTYGRYHVRPKPPYSPGSDVSGVVVSAPAGSEFKTGDRVAAFPRLPNPSPGDPDSLMHMLGGFAEYAVATADMTFPLPEAVSFQDGVALALNYLTAWFALVKRGQLDAGETVVVHGAAGGVGSAGIQIAKAFGAGRVIAVTSTPEKGEAAVNAGADQFVPVETFRESVTELGGADVILDPVGGTRFADSLRILNSDGRLLVVGFAEGEIPTVQANRLLLKNTAVVGVGFPYVPARPDVMRAAWDAVVPHAVSRELTPLIADTFPLDEVSKALDLVEGRRSMGKVLLSLR
jgi:NADPH2:quinone reductase